MRWIFSNITANSFQWRRVVSPDNGATWQLQKDMMVQRVPASETLESLSGNR